jgi:hypothetical protein
MPADALAIGTSRRLYRHKLAVRDVNMILFIKSVPTLDEFITASTYW